ncbi:MAG: amino acid ABC transporter substrate-binding protein [Ectothiorhodospiraceae bacterium AqS1]|nr:amino acid ABC transporter substrate-binding protein [Ectothiorhodospiraceae bacterium AqS1]
MATFAFAGTSAHSAMLDDIRAADEIKCGINTVMAGYSETNDEGEWIGFNVSYCRALAAAVLGDAKKVEFVNLTSKNRFPALQAGEVDILSNNTTWTTLRDVHLGFTFVGVQYYDGQGFIGRKSLGIESAKDIDGASICALMGTTTEMNLADFARINKISYESVPIETNAEARAAYLSERCDLYTSDASGLAATRASFTDPDEHMIFPEIISKEPLGPVVSQGDDQWADIARWTLNALIIAEELGITQANVRAKAQGTDDPQINRLLGSEGDFGAMLGLDKQWAVRAIEAEGNYAEVFERYIGSKSHIGLERGLNALYKDGGLLYAPPFR